MPKVVAGYKEEARKAIVEAAATVFAQKGYNDATMDDIAKELGVSKGAVYQYFSSKDELFQELCGAVAKMVEEKLQGAFSGPDLRSASAKYMTAELDRFQKRGIVMFEAFAQAPRNPAINKMVRNNYSTVKDVMTRFLQGLRDTGSLKQEMDPSSVAELLIILRHGTLATMLFGASREDAMRMWLNGFDSIVGPFVIDKSQRGKGNRN